MIVTILRGLIAPIAVMMVVTLRRLVVTVLSLLVAVLVLSVLRANRQWNQSGERERRHCKNNRLPKLLTHGDCPYVVWLERV
jgi:Ca2+/Na+ antiporter